VIDDREHYKTLKYIDIAPIRIPYYLLGRGWLVFNGLSLGGHYILAGILFLHVSFDPLGPTGLLFFVSLFIGVIMLSMMGLVLAAVSLLVVRHASLYGRWSQRSVIPVQRGDLSAGGAAEMVATGWFCHSHHLLARTYAPVPDRECGPGLSHPGPLSNMELLGILVGLSVLFGVLSILVFRHCDRLARERGLPIGRRIIERMRGCPERKSRWTRNQLFSWERQADTPIGKILAGRLGSRPGAVEWGLTRAEFEAYLSRRSNGLSLRP